MDIQKIPSGRETSKSVAASAASRPAVPVEDTRKSAFSQMKLAAPSVKGKANQNVSPDNEPGIAMESNSAAASGAVSSGLVGSHGNQPAVPIPVGGEVKPVQLLSSVPPVYPQLAKSQRIAGDVKIDATIDESGHVTGMKVVMGPVMLHQAAMDALHQWKYRPATLDGKPVAMHLLVTIQFRLQ
jgi:TonB family protein